MIKSTTSMEPAVDVVAISDRRNRLSAYVNGIVEPMTWAHDGKRGSGATIPEKTSISVVSVFAVFVRSLKYNVTALTIKPRPKSEMIMKTSPTAKSDRFKLPRWKPSNVPSTTMMTRFSVAVPKADIILPVM